MALKTGIFEFQRRVIFIMPKIPQKPDKSVDKDYGEWSTKQTLLSSTLQLAVPLWIDQMRRQPWEVIQERATICSQHIAEHGDLILFRGKKKGESAEAFNRLAEGIACLSFVPGGVKVFGGHWEACLASDIPARSAFVLGGLCDVIVKALKDAQNTAKNSKI